VSHGNARTTVHGRTLIVARPRARCPQAASAITASAGFDPMRSGVRRYRWPSRRCPVARLQLRGMAGPRKGRRHIHGFLKASWAKGRDDRALTFGVAPPIGLEPITLRFDRGTIDSHRLSTVDRVRRLADEWLATAEDCSRWPYWMHKRCTRPWLVRPWPVIALAPLDSSPRSLAGLGR
jgi:hypothetical protein